LYPPAGGAGGRSPDRRNPGEGGQPTLPADLLPKHDYGLFFLPKNLIKFHLPV